MSRRNNRQNNKYQQSSIIVLCQKSEIRALPYMSTRVQHGTEGNQPAVNGGVSSSCVKYL